MKRLLLALICLVGSSSFAIDHYEINGGLGIGYYADALGWGPHLGAGVALDRNWVVGIESGLFFFGNSRSRASQKAAAEVSSRLIPILLTGRYVMNKAEGENTVYYVGLSLGLALLNEKSTLTIGGAPALSLSENSSTTIVLGKVGMESPLLPESKLSGYAEFQAGVVRDIFAGFLNAGMRLGF